MTTAVLDEPIVRVPGKYERLCWERHERDLALSLQLGGHPKGFYFDAAAGQRVVDFIERYCKHHKGEWAGEPLLLEEWQKNILRITFGWMRPDGTRRYRTAYIEIPRKNGKSELAGGVGLYMLIADDEPGAEIYSTATKKDQAKIVWGAAEAMVKASPALKKFVRAYKNNLSCERLAGKFEPLSAESGTMDGLNAHAQLADEAHAHKDRHVYDVVATSMGSRRQPMNWVITTAGVYNPETIGWELHERAIQVLEGVIEDDTFFAFIAAADKDDDWELDATIAKANPNAGVSVKWEYLRDQRDRARSTPTFLNTYLRYHLDRWTEQIERWIPIEMWNACDRIVKESELEGQFCYAALDLSSKLDITSLTYVFPRPLGLYDFVFRFWCPEDTIMKRSKEDRVPYDAWARDGWITPTPGNVVDYEFPIAELAAASKRFKIQETAFDPWNATATATDLQEKGLVMVEFGQGYKSMSEPTKEFEKLIVAKQIGHMLPDPAKPDGPGIVHPVMRWMVANVAVKRDPADNLKPDKSSAIGRIDGVVSSIMGLGRAIVSPTVKESVYANRGVRSF